MAVDGQITETVKWACNIDPAAKWGDVNYGVIGMIKASDKKLSMDYTTAVFAMQPNRTTLLQPTKPDAEMLIFDVQDHINQKMLANIIKQDLHDFNSEANQLTEEAQKVQIQRSKCAQAAAWKCMSNKNVRVMPDKLIPSQEQTISVLLSHTDNDPFNKPTVIKVMLIPEMATDAKMEIKYRYTTGQEPNIDYGARLITVNRRQFPVPEEDSDFRFGIFKEQIERWITCVATHKKADKNTFKQLKYTWETTKPLFEGCVWNQFQKDFILNRYSAKETQAIQSYR